VSGASAPPRPLIERRPVLGLCVLAAGMLPVAILAQFAAGSHAARTRLESSIFRPLGEAEREVLARKSFGMYLPHSRSLHYAALANDSLAAGAVWIKAAGYVSREFASAYKGRKFEWLKKLYTCVAELDPHWVAGCRVGAVILAAVGQDPTGAIELLLRGMRENPDSWELPYEAGVTCLLWPGHAADAAKYFRMAARRPGHPEVIEHVLPRLMAEAGRLEEAVRHARARARGDFAALAEASRRQLEELFARLLQADLEDAIERFRRDCGRAPTELAELRRRGYLLGFDLHFAEETVLPRPRALLDRLRELRGGPEGRAQDPAAPLDLVRSGFLQRMVLAGELPPPEAEDPFGRRFLYHAPSGTVRSEGLADIDARRTLSILQAASNRFARLERRTAASLQELAEHWAGVASRGKPLPQDWVACFAGGRPPEHPLAAWGAGYSYDPATGAVGTLPARP